MKEYKHGPAVVSCSYFITGTKQNNDALVYTRLYIYIYSCLLSPASQLAGPKAERGGGVGRRFVLVHEQCKL